MTPRLKQYRKTSIRMLLADENSSAEEELLKELDAVWYAMSGLERAEAALVAKELGKMPWEQLQNELGASQ